MAATTTPELLQVYDERLIAADGKLYAIQAHSAQQGHAWYGWLEFVPLGGGPALRTARETTQPDREWLHHLAKPRTHAPPPTTSGGGCRYCKIWRPPRRLPLPPVTKVLRVVATMLMAPARY